MKKLLLSFLPLLLLSSAVFAQPQYFINSGTGGNLIPFGGSAWVDQRCQLLWTAGEFGTPPVGFITKIYFRASGSYPASTYTNLTIDMGQNTLTSLPGNAWVPGMTNVLTSASYSTPATSAGTWVEYPLQTPFFFDPTLTLIVDTRQTATTGGYAIYNGTAAGTRRQYAASAAPAPAGSGAQRYDFGFDITPGFPCTGMPTTNLTGPSQVCPTKPFVINFTSFYTGVTRQWQKSTNGTTWTNFTGTINPVTGSLSDAITVPTWYRCIITCIATNQTFTTAPKFVDISAFYYCYCDGSKATSSAGVDVGNVTVTTMPGNQVLLSSGNPNPFLSNPNANKSYSNFRDTVPAVPMYHDSSYFLQLQQTSSTATFSAASAAIFIDYNRNGTFDPWERVLQENTSQALPNPGMVRDTFTVPDSAQYGLTGMRVILRAGNTPPDTCTGYPEGETEDYLVDLRYRPCDSIPITGVIEGDTSMCIGYDYILTDTTYQTKRHGLSRFWQVSADAIGWSDIAASDNKDTLMRVFNNGQPLYYRMRMICSHTDDTAFTPVHKVNLKPTYKCYCFSQSLGGANDTSDVGGFGIYKFEANDGGAHLGNPRAVRKRQDRTDLQPIEMWVDSIYQFHVFHTMPNEFHSDAKITVFADFNNNHAYDIPNERIFMGFTNVGYHTLINNILIPNAAIADVPTGLRVIVNNNVGPNTASDDGCGTYTSGETEDYMLIFRRPFNVGLSNTTVDLRGVQVYPNPSNGKFTVDFYSGNTIKEVKLRIMTVTGQQILSEVHAHGGGRFTKELNLETQAKGVYFIEIDADGIRTKQRVVLR